MSRYTAGGWHNINAQGEVERLPRGESPVLKEIRRRITDGVYQPGDRLPSVSELMLEFGAYRGTVGRALQTLADEGLTVSYTGNVRGRGGTFVRVRHLVQRDLDEMLRLAYATALEGGSSRGLFERVTGLSEDQVEVQVRYEWVDAPPRVAALLERDGPVPVLARSFFYLIEQVPHQDATSWLPVEVAERAGLTGPECDPPGTSTLLHLLRGGYLPGPYRRYFNARMPTVEERATLAIPRGTPVVEHWAVLKDRQYRPLEVSASVVPGDQVEYTAAGELPEVAG